eukprot:SAG31_NODE_1062_length_10105_cov_11.143814_8_plen_82_part_00
MTLHVPTYMGQASGPHQSLPLDHEGQRQRAHHHTLHHCKRNPSTNPPTLYLKVSYLIYLYILNPIFNKATRIEPTGCSRSN